MDRNAPQHELEPTVPAATDPPLLQIAYASVIAEYVDRVIAIVPHGSNVNTVEDLQARFELIGTPITGHIYNRGPLRPEMTRTEGDQIAEPAGVEQPGG